VHDKIPATLIADSAAAALMQAGRVQGVVVGADRVAANGIQYFQQSLGSVIYVQMKGFCNRTLPPLVSIGMKTF